MTFRKWLVLLMAVVFCADASARSFTVPPITIINDGNVNADPGLAKLNDGRYIVCYVTGLNQLNATISIKLSSDKGATWSAPTVILTPAASHTYAGCDLSMDGAGHILLTTPYETNDGTVANTLVFVGTVGGGGSITWDAGTNTCANVTGNFVNVCYSQPNKILVLDNGTWLQGIYNPTVGAYTSAVVACVACNPSAQVWSAQTNIATSVATRYNEIGLVQLPDHSVIAMIRADGSFTIAGFWRSTSSDRGATWSAPSRDIFVGAPGGPDLVLTTNYIYLISRDSQHTWYWTTKTSPISWSSEFELSTLNYCYGSGFDAGSDRANAAICLGTFDQNDNIGFWTLTPLNYLLAHDLDAGNDNSPAWLDRVA